MLIDVQTCEFVDVPPDRSADSPLPGWLRSHPGVQVVCLDRAGCYAEGAARAPVAIQVAGR